MKAYKLDFYWTNWTKLGQTGQSSDKLDFCPTKIQRIGIILKSEGFIPRYGKKRERVRLDEVVSAYRRIGSGRPLPFLLPVL